MNTEPEPHTIHSAADVLGAAPDLPAGTPGMVDAPRPDGAAPAPSAAPAQLDRKGQPWDLSAGHEDPPRINSEGLWAKRRGNPKFGRRPTKAATTPGDAAPPPSNHAAAPVGDSFLGSAGPGPADQGAIQAELMPPASLSEADYEGTARGLVRVLFGVFQLIFGQAWEPGDKEAKEHREAYCRALAYLQAPRLGPLAELVPLWIETAAKRRKDHETLTRWARMRAWFRRGTGSEQMGDTAAPRQNSGPRQVMTQPSEPRPDAPIVHGISPVVNL